MRRPDVTVVIPTRDRAGRLRFAIRSALAQRDVDVEVLVVDDDSTDETPAVVGAIDDARVRYVRLHRRGGVSVARNEGIERATAPWIAFLDDDDVWAPTKLTRQLAEVRRSGRDWAYAGEVLTDADLHVIGGAPPPPPEDLVRGLSFHNSVPAGASNVLVAARVLSAVGGFDPSLTNNEDWDMWIRLARRGPPAYVRSPLVAIAGHTGNASQNMLRMLEELDVIAARYGVPVDRARHLRWAAWTALLGDDRRGAVRFYLRAAALGDAPSLSRAAIAAIVPVRLISRLRGASISRRADPWLEEARGWLRAFDRT